MPETVTIPQPGQYLIKAGFREGVTADPMEVTCAVCAQPGVLVDMDERGFLIRHPARVFPCRAPR